MALSEPRYIVDVANKTAQLDIFIDDEFITSYSYYGASNKVTLAKRLNTDEVSVNEFLRAITDIGEWLRIIRRLLKPPYSSSYSIFSEEMKKKVGKVEGKMSVVDTVISDIEYKHIAALVAFKPRPEITISLNDFSMWFNFLERLYKTIITF